MNNMIKNRVLETNNIAKGLCFTCNNSPTCFHSKRYNQSIQFCEQFDNYVPSNTVYPDTNTELYFKNVKNCEGICINCDLVENCLLHDNGLNISFCEEYV